LAQPRCTLPLAIYARTQPKSQGQRRGLVKADGRSIEGRILRDARKALLDFVGPDATPIQKSLIERAAMLELRAAMLDQKIIDGTFTEYDSKVYNAIVNSIARVYRTLGIERPRPEFSRLWRPKKKAQAA